MIRASPRPVAVWRAGCVVAPVFLVKVVNGDIEQFWAARQTCRQALPLAAMRCIMEEFGVLRGLWGEGGCRVQTKEKARGNRQLGRHSLISTEVAS
jgi:hypothetical protein